MRHVNFALLLLLSGAGCGGGTSRSNQDAGPPPDMLGLKCSNGIKDGDETAIDCGGSICPKCGLGLACSTDGDCKTGNCANRVCGLAPLCTDGIRNGKETDVDCGGGCPACRGAKSCMANGDCLSGSCSGGKCSGLKVALSFAAAATFPADTGPVGMGAADFDRDGKWDVVMLSGGAGAAMNASVLRGMGNGTLAAAIASPLGASCGGLAVADFNRDFLPDLAALGLDTRMLAGKGDGTFGAPSAQAVPGGTTKNVIVAGDFNGDGRADLAITSHDTGDIHVLLTKPDGTIGTPTPTHVGKTPDGLAAADFNNDGSLDLLVALHDSNAALLLTGLGDGTLQVAASIMTASGPATMASGDLNGDGLSDVVVNCDGALTVQVLLGDRQASFKAQTPVMAGRAQGMWIDDMDGDGKRDFVIGNGRSVVVYRGNGDGTLAGPVSFDVTDSIDSIAVADFNADGLPDIAASLTQASKVALLINTSK